MVAVGGARRPAHLAVSRRREDHGGTEHRGNIMARISRRVPGWSLASACSPSPWPWSAPAHGRRPMTRLGSVSGVVTAGGAPAGGGVGRPDAGDRDRRTGRGSPSRWPPTRTGRYPFDDARAGHVKVHVRAPLTGNYVATFWPGVYTFGQAGIDPGHPRRIRGGHRPARRALDRGPRGRRGHGRAGGGGASSSPASRTPRGPSLRAGSTPGGRPAPAAAGACIGGACGERTSGVSAGVERAGRVEGAGRSSPSRL